MTVEQPKPVIEIPCNSDALGYKENGDLFVAFQNTGFLGLGGRLYKGAYTPSMHNAPHWERPVIDNTAVIREGNSETFFEEVAPEKAQRQVRVNFPQYEGSSVHYESRWIPVREVVIKAIKP